VGLAMGAAGLGFGVYVLTRTEPGASTGSAVLRVRHLAGASRGLRRFEMRRAERVRGRAESTGLGVCSVLACAAVSWSCSTFEGLSIAHRKLNREGGAAACGHAKVVPPPTDHFTDQADLELVVALRTFGLPAADFSNESIGLDLDGKCTGEGEGSSCLEPSWAGEHRDGRDGRDNAVGGQYLSDGGTLASKAAWREAAANSGRVTTVLRVRHYDGFTDDDDIAVDWLEATRSPDSVGQVPNPPSWDGLDDWKPFVEWSLPATPADGGPGWSAKYTSSSAYVTNLSVVAHFDLVRLAPALYFSDVWIQASILQGGSSLALHEGVFAGRVRLDDLLANEEHLPDPATGTNHTCKDSLDYAQAKRATCGLADIGFAVSADPSAPCDAASWAWTFDAAPARLASDVDPTVLSILHECPEGTRPSEDHCATLDHSQ
jgi:hypothetical protein